MKRKISNEQLNIIKEYAERLSSEKNRLKFTNKELANAIKKSEKTVERYMKGENSKLPPREVRKSIEDFINSHEGSDNYKRQTPKQFGNLLADIMTELRVTQQQFADMIGKDQRTVSQYISGEINTSASEQYNILKCIYIKESENCRYGCILPYGAYDIVHDTLKDDEEKRFAIKFAEEIADDYREEDDDIGEQKDLLDFFDTLSSDLQVQILRHYRAFFEQTEEQVENCVTMMLASYYERERLMNDFMYISEKERSSLVYEFEQNSLMTYPRLDDTEEVIYFSAVADMRSLIFDKEYYDVLESMKKKTKPNKSNKNRFLLEQLIHRHGLMRGSLDELKMKLNFSSYDWYVWSLLLIYFHNKDDED